MGSPVMRRTRSRIATHRFWCLSQGIPVTNKAPKLAYGRGLRPAGGLISHRMPTQYIYELTRDAHKAFPDSYPQILVSQ
jgi:hypothetical protein